MRIVCLFLAFFGFIYGVFAQAQKADSLERILPGLTGVDRAIVLNELVSIYNRSDHSKLKQTLAEVKELSKSNDNVIRSYTLLSLAIGKTTEGLSDSAIYLLKKSKDFAVRANNPRALIRVCGALGRFLISEGKAQEGLENLFEALKLLESNPDKEIEFKVRTNVSYAYLELKQFQNCIDFGNQSLALMNDPKYEYIILYIYNNSAIAYGQMHMLDSARSMVEKGLKISKAVNDNQAVANSYFILGTIYLDAGEYDKAVQQYEQAIPYRQKVGNPFFLASDLQSLSDLYCKTGRFKDGIRVGEQALEIATKHNFLLKFENSHLVLAQNYKGLGDYKQASKYYEMWAIAKDSIYKNSSASAVAEMQTKYETAKKEQQITLQNLELSEQKAQLQKTYLIIAALISIAALGVLVLRGRFKRKQLVAEQEKEIAVRETFIDATIRSQETERKRFAQDLHDGMGQLISSLRLMVGKLEKNTSLEDKIEIAERSDKILNEMHTEIRSIAFNLMPQTLIQQGLVPALQEMALRVNQSGKIIISVAGYDIPERMNEVYEISLYRIIQEWTNNIIKYADATKIEIQLVGHEEEINVTIEDNGTGFDPARLELSKGNGWKNIKSRVNLIKGEVDVDSAVQRNGTTFMLKIPVLAGQIVPANIN